MFKAWLRDPRTTRCLPLLSKPLAVVARRKLLTQSLAQGPSHPPLLEQTVGQNFANIVAAYGDRAA